MPSRRPEQYQLALDFGQRPEVSISSAYQTAESVFDEFDSRELGIGRFVRAVNEAVFLRAPTDAAYYLQEKVFCPFGEFPKKNCGFCVYTKRFENTPRRSAQSLLAVRYGSWRITGANCNCFRSSVISSLLTSRLKWMASSSLVTSC